MANGFEEIVIDEIPLIRTPPTHDDDTFPICKNLSQKLSFEGPRYEPMELEMPELTTLINDVYSESSIATSRNPHSSSHHGDRTALVHKEEQASSSIEGLHIIHSNHSQKVTKKRKASIDPHFQEQFSGWLSTVDIDWSQTLLGPMQDWPALWKSYVCLMTSIKTPIALYWSPDLVAMFNPAYVTIAGPNWKTKIGKSFKDAWAGFPDMITLFHGVFDSGQSLNLEKQLFFLDQAGTGLLQETYWDVTTHPIYNATGKIEGLLCQSLEFTDEIITDRRMRMLSGLSKNTAAVSDESGFWEKFMESMDLNQ